VSAKGSNYLPPDPDVGEELEGFPVPVLVGEEPPVLGGALTLLELPIQVLSELGWTVTMSEYATAPVLSLRAMLLWWTKLAHDH
jgi:hypothetical protein